MPDEQAELLRTLHDEHAPALWRYVVWLTRQEIATEYSPERPTAPIHPLTPGWSPSAGPDERQRRLVPREWGTRLDMDCHHSRPGPADTSGYSASAAVGYAMFVTDAAGNSSQVATWTPSSGSSAEPSGTTGVAAAEKCRHPVRGRRASLAARETLAIATSNRIDQRRAISNQ